MVVENTNVSADFGKVATIDFANKFNDNITNLLELLGVTRKYPLSSDCVIQQYTWTTDVKDGTVAEGEVIPLSKATRKPKELKRLEWKKYRRKTTAEAIARFGVQIAVNDGNNEIKKKLQKNIKADIVKGLTEGAKEVAGGNLQKALATVMGNLQEIEQFDGEDFVYFANTMDVADYLGDNTVTPDASNVFGMTLYKNFLGIGNLIVMRDLPKGFVTGTAVDNLVFANLDMRASGVSGVFNLVTDETGYIGIGTENEMSTLTTDAVFLTVNTIFAEVPEGVIKAPVTALEETKAKAAKAKE